MDGDLWRWRVDAWRGEKPGDVDRCLVLFGDERRLWSLDIWCLIIGDGDDDGDGVVSNGNDEDKCIDDGDCDCDGDEQRFLLFLAFTAIDIISIVGSDGNKRHKASAQRGSISLKYKKYYFRLYQIKFCY